MHSIKPSAKQKIQVKKQRSTARKPKDGHLLFWPVLLVVFLIWVAYRYLTSFPVWFDETLGKAVFFALPIWFYVISTGFRSVAKLFQPEKFWKGVFLGLALGGVFGFFVVLLRLMTVNVLIQPQPIFLADNFWYEMLMGLFTSFWETLFFFGFVAGVLLEKYPKLGLLGQAVLTAAIFSLFHLPNTLLRFQGTQAVISMVFILTLFALGQFLIYYRRRNGYALVLSQLIWGMALLVYGW